MDSALIRFLNQFAMRSRAFDMVVVEVANNNLLKGGVILALFWAAWFDGRDRYRREILVCTIAAAFGALVVTRVLTVVLPFRERPLHTAALGFQAPYMADVGTLRGWSSFPSDHATLFAAMATGIWLASRRLGWIAVGWVAVMICLPRVYCGYHYPTDILVGALVGVAAAACALLPRLRGAIASRPLALADRSPAIFYAGMFILTEQMTELFDSARTLASLAKHVLTGDFTM